MYKSVNEVVIEKIAAGGSGLGRIGGRVVFVPFVLPGEVVSFRILNAKKDYAVGELVEVKRKSPHRVKPLCKFYGLCGGCNFQHMEYTEQLKQKENILKEAFFRTGKIDLSIQKVVGSKEFNYRSRVQFHTDRQGIAGFKEKGSDSIVKIDNCPVCVKTINDFLSARPEICKNSRFLVFGDENAFYVEKENRNEIIRLNILNKEVVFPLTAFFQANSGILPSVIDYVKKDAGGETLLDLYSGVGVFGSYLGEFFNRVVFVEENPAAVKYAKINAPSPKNRFYSSRVETWIQKEGKKYFPETIFVDPPRTGLSPGVRKYIIDRRPRALLYLSCNPVTMARDAGTFINSGWKIDDAVFFDFFPQTSHIELFLKLKPE